MTQGSISIKYILVCNKLYCRLFFILRSYDGKIVLECFFCVTPYVSKNNVYPLRKMIEKDTHMVVL